jgi:Cu2+-exporting ATPase
MKKKYTCPMHADVVQITPGICPKCGMELIGVEESETERTDEKSSFYTCPMHPYLREKKSGKCPRCGMDLVKVEKKVKHSIKAGMGVHDHSMMMSSPSAAKDFLHRFFVVSALLIPLLFFSEPAVRYLGFPNFIGRDFLEFGIATAIFYYGLVFFQHAKMEIQMRQYGMMTLVSLGVGAGYLFSAASTFFPELNTEFYLEISTLIWVLLFGHFLEAKSSVAAGDALSEVAELLPKKAHLKIRRGNEDIDVSSLEVGNVVLVKPGEKVPADGEVVKGNGNFNESHITGESKLVAKSSGDFVVAGALSVDGSLEIKLKRVGENSTVGQIQNLISAAKLTKPNAQKLADKASKWLTFSAIGVSMLALFVWLVVVGQTFVFALTLSITVLVIACPHALGLAIPTVSTIATKLATTNGIFIKDMGKLEVAKGVDWVVFDKTGTLTKGNFSVTSVKPNKILEKEFLEIVASLEKNSSHVIATSILEYTKKKKVRTKSVSSFKNLGGQGVKGTIDGTEYFLGKTKPKWKKEEGTSASLYSGDKFLGTILLSDEVKKTSKQSVNGLHKLGVKVAMLTGDSKRAAEPVAEKLGIDTVFAEVLPEDKYKYVKRLQEKGEVVIMAGDGVNDAPALTQADVGVAIGAGTDVAVEAGDIVLTQSDPEHLVRLIVLARKVYRKMLENLFWALGYNIIAIPSAAGLFVPFGFRLTPAVGAFVMSLSSVIVVINAMSLRKAKLG